MLPNRKWTVESLSNWLFDTDPAHTCCKENDCFDEYDYIAATAVDFMDSGDKPQAALDKALALWFGTSDDDAPYEIMEDVE